MSDVNFTIVESSNRFDYDGFKKDYCDCKLSKAEIMKKYGLSNGSYYNRVKSVKRETGFTRPRNHHHLNNPMRYIYPKKNGTVLIQKYIKKRKVYYGTYASVEDAIKARAILEANDWSDEAYQECRLKYGKTK